MLHYKINNFRGRVDMSSRVPITSDEPDADGPGLAAPARWHLILILATPIYFGSLLANHLRRVLGD